MELRTSSLRLPQVGSGQQIHQKIEIANSGRGYLRGEIMSTQSWLKVKPSFSCPLFAIDIPNRRFTIPA
jgi:hypothetical protein